MNCDVGSNTSMDRSSPAYPLHHAGITMLQQRAGVRKTYLGSTVSTALQDYGEHIAWTDTKSLPEISLLHVAKNAEVEISFLSHVRLYLLCVMIFWACLPCYKSLQKFTFADAKEKTGPQLAFSFAKAACRRLAVIV